MKSDKTIDTAAEAAKDSKPSKGKRAMKTGLLLAAAGLAAYGVAKGIKSARGRAAVKKVKASVKKTVRKAKSGVRAATRKPATRGRSKSRSR